MNKPKKYYQIVTPDTQGILRPFEVNQFGEVDPFFQYQAEAEEFIRNNFIDSQDGVNPEKIELVLSILPVWLVKFK